MIYKNNLQKAINETIETKRTLIKLEKNITRSIEEIFKSISNKGKIFFCGNGGSAADAQHLAAELLVRLRPKVNRNPIPSISLAMDSSTLTACGNDYNFNKIFSRPFEALANKNDILFVISTSGNSKNIIEVLKSARKKNILSIGLLGCKGGLAKNFCKINIIVDSNVVARIQESHIFLGHFILQSVEDLIIKKK